MISHSSFNAFKPMQAKVFKTSEDQEFKPSERCFILELSNSRADETLSVARVRVEPAVTTAWHSIDGTDERYVILEGGGKPNPGDGRRSASASVTWY